MNSILSYFRDVFQKIISGGKDVNTSMLDNLISDKMAAHLMFAEHLYENNTEYIDWLRSGEVKSLRLASVVAREIATKVCLETKITVSGQGERAEYLNRQLALFLRKLPIYVEQAVALGNLAFKPYVDGDNVYIKAAKLGSFIPVRYNSNGTYDACIFVSKLILNDTHYTKLEYHHIENGIYTVENTAYKANNSFNYGLGQKISLAEIPEWADISPIVTLSGDIRPLYSVYSNPFANSIDTDSPLGASIFADCIDLIREADEMWERSDYEVRSGERRIYAPPQSFQNIGGNTYKVSRFYKTFNADDDNFFREFSPVFRNEAIEAHLQTIFKRIEQNIGTSFGTISDPMSVERTATEVKNSKERLYNTVTAIQRTMKSCIEQAVDAADRICDLYGIGGTKGDYQLVCSWDDSVIESKDEIAARALSEYQNGLIDTVEYFMQTKGMNEEEATAYVQKIKQRSPENVGADWFDDKGVGA